MLFGNNIKKLLSAPSPEEPHNSEKRSEPTPSIVYTAVTALFTKILTHLAFSTFPLKLHHQDVYTIHHLHRSHSWRHNVDCSSIPRIHLDPPRTCRPRTRLYPRAFQAYPRRALQPVDQDLLPSVPVCLTCRVHGQRRIPPRDQG